MPAAPVALCRYQLCRADQELTEECFASNKLAFAPQHQQKVIYNDESKNHMIDMTIVTEGGGTSTHDPPPRTHARTPTHIYV